MYNIITHTFPKLYLLRELKRPGNSNIPIAMNTFSTNLLFSSILYQKKPGKMANSRAGGREIQDETSISCCSRKPGSAHGDIKRTQKPVLSGFRWPTW